MFTLYLSEIKFICIISICYMSYRQSVFHLCCPVGVHRFGIAVLFTWAAILGKPFSAGLCLRVSGEDHSPFYLASSFEFEYSASFFFLYLISSYALRADINMQKYKDPYSYWNLWYIRGQDHAFLLFQKIIF